MQIFSTKILLIFLVLACLYTQVQARQTTFTITGKVTDNKKNPVQGVSVTEVDTEKRIVRGISTDVNGNFSLRISNSKHKLSFSNIGYLTIEELPINSRRVFNVTLESSSRQ